MFLLWSYFKILQIYRVKLVVNPFITMVENYSIQEGKDRYETKNKNK